MQASPTNREQDAAQCGDSDVLRLFSGIVSDYLQWRRQFQDAPPAVGFADSFDQRRLHSGLRKLAHHFSRDYPFHNPRYVGHMLSEVSLPALLGYLAGMLHNENTVTPEAGPVGAALEHAACSRVLRMLGYKAPPPLPKCGAPADAYNAQVADGGYGWAHLTSGGSSANLEALWVARTVRQVSLAITDVCRAHGWPLDTRRPNGSRLDVRELAPREVWLLRPQAAINLFFDFRSLVANTRAGNPGDVWTILAESGYAPQSGLGALLRELQPVVFVTPAAHYSIAKSTNLLGFGQLALRPIPFDSQMRADPRALREQLLALRPEEVPLCVVAVAGTTVDGTIDPVDRFARLRSRLEAGNGLSFWLHADAAYGGYLRSLLRRPQGDAGALGEPPLELRRGDYEEEVELNWRAGRAAQALRALPLADSITCDNHKLGYNPYPSGLIAFQDDRVRAFVSQRAPYITSSQDSDCWRPARTVAASADGMAEAITHEAYGVYTLECSRPGAAASALWLATQTIPLNRAGHGRLLAQTLRAARELHEWLSRWPEVLAANGLAAEVEFVPIAARPPDTNVLVFAVKPPGKCTLAQVNSLTRALHRRFQISAELGETRHPATQDYWLSKSVYRAGEFTPESLRGFWERAAIDMTPNGDNAQTYQQAGLFALRAAVMNPHCATASADNSLMLKLVEALYRSACFALNNVDYRAYRDAGEMLCSSGC